MDARVVVVEDDEEVRTLLVRFLRRRGYSVEEARDGIEGLACVEKNVPDVVVTDMAMPGLDGLGLLKALKQMDPDMPVIVLTGHGSLENILQSMREGALFDYLMKPLPDLTLLEVAVLRAVEVRRLRARAREADQVVAMRELAMTVADRILNPLNVIGLSLLALRRDMTRPDVVAQALTRTERAIRTITQVVQQMSKISRYTPREVVQGLREIDLDTATSAGAEEEDAG
jgi:FixJ family two-component response regulator